LNGKHKPDRPSASLNPEVERSYKRFKKEIPPAEEFVRKIREGDKAWLGRAITLIESQSPADREVAQAVIKALLPYAGNSFRIGITGVPGVGKSSFIDRLGTHYIRRGHKVAVLAVDPSSSVHKGSLLGDKTRMKSLLEEENSFIRPSPSGDFLGGVARKTREAIILAEAAGYDRILVETVGVGQSEVYVRHITDMLVLLKLPAAGDELQGMKRGIMEMADLILINKADGALKEEAERAARTFRNALQLFTYRPAGEAGVMAVSSFSDEDVSRVLEHLENFYQKLKSDGSLEALRNEQLKFWFDETLQEYWQNLLRSNENLQREKEKLYRLVVERKISPFDAAEQLWNKILRQLKNS